MITIKEAEYQIRSEYSLWKNTPSASGFSDPNLYYGILVKNNSSMLNFRCPKNRDKWQIISAMLSGL